MTRFAEFFPDVQLSEFLRSGHREPIVHHGPVTRFGWPDVPALDVEVVIAESSFPGLEVFFADPARGRPTALNVAPSEAAKLYRLGATVEMPIGDSGPLQSVSDYFYQLADEIGVRVEAIMCLFSPGGEAVPMHFDRQSVFVLHLVGAKQWTIAPPSVEYPTTAVFPTTFGARRDGYRPAYFPETLPDTMPPGHRQVTLTPGAAMFLPVGYWHQTTTSAPSISVTMVPTCHSFLDLIKTRIEQLVSHAEFRRPLFEILDPERNPADTEAQLADLLEVAVRELRRESLVSVLPFLPRRDRIRFAPGLSGVFEDDETLTLFRDGLEMISIDVDADDREFWSLLLEGEGPIGFAEARTRYAGSDDELSRTLRALYHEGLIVRCEPGDEL